MPEVICGCTVQSLFLPTQRLGQEQTMDELIDVKQRRIQGVNSVSSTEYIMHKSSLQAYNHHNNINVDTGDKPIQKNDSYQRRLAKLKGDLGVLRDEKTSAPYAKQGGKVKRFGLFKNCC